MNNILVIEDEKDYKNILLKIINDIGKFNIYETDNGDNAIELCSENYFDIILTDLAVPGTNGDELIKNIRNYQRYAEIIICTANMITKNDEIRLRKLKVNEIYEKTKGTLLLKIIIENILENSYLIKIDDTTKTLSKNIFPASFKCELEKIKNIPNYRCSLINIDFDNLKKVNDEKGHDAGDSLLYNVSKIIHKNLRKTDHIFRVGGDEFCILMPGLKINDVEKIIKRISKKINDNKGIEKIAGFRYNISYGITELTKNDTQEKAFKRSDELMYKNKVENKK